MGPKERPERPYGSMFPFYQSGGFLSVAAIFHQEPFETLDGQEGHVKLESFEEIHETLQDTIRPMASKSLEATK